MGPLASDRLLGGDGTGRLYGLLLDKILGLLWSRVVVCCPAQGMSSRPDNGAPLGSGQARCSYRAGKAGSTGLPHWCPSPVPSPSPRTPAPLDTTRAPTRASGSSQPHPSARPALEQTAESDLALRAAQRRTATEAPALGRLGTGPSALRTNGGAAPASAPAGPHLPRPAEGGGPQRRAVRLGHSSPLRHGSFATRRPPERLAERLAGLCLTSLDRLCIIALVACGDGFGCLSVGWDPW